MIDLSHHPGCERIRAGPGVAVADDSGFSNELLAFIREHIHSIEQLEVLLMIRRRADVEWTPASVSEEMRTGVPSASTRMKDLESRGLLQSTKNGTQSSYRYAPRTPELESAVAELDRAYAERRYTIIDLIFSKPVDKIRVFAEAFRIRRGEGEGDQ
jgi:hypothetical protein